MKPVDYCVEGLIVTGDARGTTFEAGSIAVIGDRIEAVGPKGIINKEYEATHRLGGARYLVHPGFVDCHQHASQALVRSLIAHELPMIYRLYIPAEIAMTADDVRISANLLQSQLLRSGVTTFAETTVDPTHEEVISEAVTAAGMRCVMARGAGDQTFHHAGMYSQVQDRSWARQQAGEAARDLERTARFLDRFDPSGSGLIKGGVHAVQITRASPEYLRDAACLAKERNASLQIHVSRDREEVEFCLSVYGRRPVEQLAELGVLSEHLLAIHAILVTDREIQLLAEAGSSVAHQPVECLNILNGIPPVRRLLDAGIEVGLGCDNAINDGYEIMRVTWILHTSRQGIAEYDPEHLPADKVFELATIGGARALRWGHAIGSIEPGKQADLVVVDLQAPHLFPVQHPVVDLVRYGSRAEVTDVMVAGRLVVRDRALTTIDEERLYADATRAGSRVAAVVSPRRYRPLAPAIKWPDAADEPV